MPNSHWPTLSMDSQISLIAVPMINTAANTCSAIDDVRSVSASAVCRTPADACAAA